MPNEINAGCPVAASLLLRLGDLGTLGGLAALVLTDGLALDADLLPTRTAVRLRLGTYPSVAARLLPALLDRLAEARPGADVTLTESSSPEELERALETGQLDLTFTVQPFTRPGLDGTALLEDAFCLLVPRGSELADRHSPVLLDELIAWPLILSGTCAHLRCLRSPRRCGHG